MTRKLFIIGNGFDLHHGIPSRYSDFGAYVEAADPEVFQLINEYLFVDENFWNCFEERLATFDSDNVIDYAETFLVSYASDEWRDRDHHSYEYEIEQVVTGLSRTMRAHFAEWIRKLPIPLPGAADPLQCIDPTGTYLSFNYTPTLQQFYGVSDCSVLHIHGRAADENSEIILGHGWERLPEEMLTPSVDEDTDVRVAGGYRLIDNYFANTFKPTEQIIERNCGWFDNLAGVTEIHVLGHSLSNVDAAYIAEIVDRVGPVARWTISYLDSDTRAREQFTRYGVDEQLVTYAPLASL